MFNWFTPKIFNQGYLPEKDGHQVFFMEAGNPKGKPVLIFHGGPGGSAKLRHAAAFDRKKYRIIMFDQRGGGQSLPNGEIKHNSTTETLGDALRLLDFLQISGKIIVRGGSWGSTLALLFAQKYPERVEALLLSQIFLADNMATTWINEISGWFYPDIVEDLQKGVRNGESLPAAYNEMINSSDLAAQVRAAAMYGNYERVLGQLKPVLPQGEVTQKDVDSTKIYLHYVAENFMLKPEQIMNATDKISHLPTLIVHNRLDMVCPLIGAWRLHKAMPKSKLVIVPEKGHSAPLLHKTIEKEIKLFLKSIFDC